MEKRRSQHSGHTSQPQTSRFINKVLIMGGVMLCIVDNARVSAQAPPVMWQVEDAVPDRPPGTLHTWNGSFPYQQSTLSAPQSHPATGSGIDWHNCVTKLYDSNGVHYGYATVGYTWFSNWSAIEACIPPTTLGAPLPAGGDLFDHRIANQTATIGAYDLDGNRLWYHAYALGTLEGVVQDKDGNIVATGATGTRAPWAGLPWAAQPIYINPTTGTQTDVSDPSFLCSPNQSQLLVIKVEPTNGNVIWNHVFTDELVLTGAYAIRTHGSALAEVDPDGIGGYRVAGWRKGPVDGNPTLRERPFILDLDVNGYLNWKKVYNASNSTINGVATFPNIDSDGRAIWIEHHPDPAVEKYVISGFRRDADNSSSNFPSAYLMYFDENNAQDPVWLEDTWINNSEYPMTVSSLRESSYRCSFAVNGGVTSILWPVLTDFVSAITATPAHEATGRVFHLDLTSSQLWPGGVNLGLMRGYDLYMDAIQLQNGNVAVSCTKSLVSEANPITWTMLDPAVQTCLAGTDWTVGQVDGVFDYDPDPNNSPPDPLDWTTYISNANTGHWYSDSYAAEVALSNGTIVWEKTWDADAENGTTSTCHPDNYRKRQCSFKIVQADDGGLVICGNTGRNREDAYLVKLGGCELDPALYTAFHALYPYNPSNVYTLTAATTTWGSSMNVRGSVVVPAGKTLTINNGAVIGFADSRKIGYTTNVVVQPGGKAIIDGGAVLTNIGPCGDGIWDGILGLGNNSSSTSATVQGTVELRNGTIENAFTAILAGNADPEDPIASPVTNRGARIICDGGTLRNNVHGVILRPINHSSVVTRFYITDFFTDGPLNYPGLTPVVHLYANSYTRLNIKGCTFDGDPNVTGNGNVAGWGKGIESYNTDLRIEPLNGIEPSFTGLRSGCFAANANGKTVRVWDGNFTGCGHGLGIVGASPAWVISTEFKVPDLDMVGQGLGAPVYGSYMEETSTFLFEYNSFYTQPVNNDFACVGSTFLNTGVASNTYYGNVYDGFDCVNCTGTESAGTTIQGTNSSLTPGSGIKFKCNTYSNSFPNAYDLAFTGGNVTVDPNQGTVSPVPDPAGNTFALNCNAEQHMYNDGGNTGINVFEYFHHAPQPGVELVPTCLTLPLTTAINTNTSEDYGQGCGGSQNMLMSSSGDQSAATANAAAEHALLKSVYEDWTDGGNTDGLEDYVQDLSHSSYNVRNQLMLMAPKVSSRVWALVFERDPAMNPWHLAQALIANSPLEAETEVMMQQSNLSPYYKQLVANEQDGISMHSIYRSELGYWLGEQSKALFAYSASAFDENPPVTFAEAIALHHQYPVPGSEQQLQILHIANSDLVSARGQVNDALTAPHNVWWDVQDLWLAQLEGGLAPDDISPAMHNQLQAYATSGEIGAALAKAWLASVGDPLSMEVILPSESRNPEAAPTSASASGAPELLGVYPNPSRGDAYVTYNLPEGMEGAELEVSDAMGRLVWTKATSRNSGIEELPHDMFQPGLYHVLLRADGLRLSSGKFTVIR